MAEETEYTHEATARRRHFVLYFGVVSGETTTWTKTCIFSESMQRSFTKDIQETVISQECDTPGAVPIKVKDVSGTGQSIAGSGWYRGWSNWKTLMAMHESVNPVPVKFEHYDSLNAGAVGVLLGTETGFAHFVLNGLDLPTTGPAAITATLEVIGTMTRTDAP